MREEPVRARIRMTRMMRWIERTMVRRGMGEWMISGLPIPFSRNKSHIAELFGQIRTRRRANKSGYQNRQGARGVW